MKNKTRRSGFGNMYGPKNKSGIIVAIKSTKKPRKRNTSITIDNVKEALSDIRRAHTESPAKVIVGGGMKKVYLDICERRGEKLKDTMKYIRDLGNGLYEITIPG